MRTPTASSPYHRLFALALGSTLAVLSAVACRKEKVTERPDAPPTSAGACEGVLRDCDGRSDNGCETRLGTTAHCGGCNVRCADGDTCLGTTCQPAGDLTMSERHTCVLEPSGRVACWGANRDGELGDGTRSMRDRPVRVPGIDDAVQLVSRDQQTCVRRRTGAVSCWGRPFSGGSGTSHDAQLVPTDVEALRDVTDIALASNVFCGLTRTGSILCLPGHTKGLSSVGPPPGEVITDAVDLAATTHQLCAARHDGSVTCWNMNPPDRSPHLDFDHVKDAVSLTSGGATICAIRASGKAMCWGGDIVTAPGYLRDATVIGVHDFGDLGAVSDLAFIGWPHTEDCAIRTGSSGETLCWAPPHVDLEPRRGDGGDGGTRDAGDAAPLRLDLTTRKLPPAHRLEATRHHPSHCVLTKAGEVHCWGAQSLGRLGVGRPPEQPSPREIEGVSGVREVVASDSRACARTASGSLTCWGAGTTPHAVAREGVERLLSGRCASIRSKLVCFDELFDKELPDSGLRDIVELVPASSGSHVLSYFARSGRGEVSRVDWKRSNGGATPSWQRTFLGAARELTGTKQLLVAGDYTCARDSTSTLRCFKGVGDPTLDGDGQLRLEPRAIKVPEGLEQLQMIRVLDSGYAEACGVRRGIISCWVEGVERSLDLRGVVRFAVGPGGGGGVRCALVAGGTLSCWDAFGGSSGDGTLAPVPEPKVVPGLTGVVGFAFTQASNSGHHAVYAWQSDGRLFAWGHNGESSDKRETGQLGWVAPTAIDQPTRVTLP